MGSIQQESYSCNQDQANPSPSRHVDPALGSWRKRLRRPILPRNMTGPHGVCTLALRPHGVFAQLLERTTPSNISISLSKGPKIIIRLLKNGWITQRSPSCHIMVTLASSRRPKRKMLTMASSPLMLYKAVGFLRDTLKTNFDLKTAQGSSHPRYLTKMAGHDTSRQGRLDITLVQITHT